MIHTSHIPACVRRPALALLAVLLFSLICPPLRPRAEPPVIDLLPLRDGWEGSSTGEWSRTDVYHTGRTGYPGRDETGVLVPGFEEVVVSKASVYLEYDLDSLANIKDRMLYGLAPNPLSDGSLADQRVKVSEDPFHGFPAVTVEVVDSWSSYAFRADGREVWNGSATYLTRYICFTTTANGPCTLITETVYAMVQNPGGLGERGERQALDAMVADADAWIASWKITPAKVERRLTVAGYDGTDTIHMPLTFPIKAEESGQPLANEPVGFRFLGDVRCLADEYAVWNGETKRWDWVSQNLAVEETLQAATDARGDLILRVVVSFDRLRLDGKTLPCTVRLVTAIAAQPGDPSTIVEQSVEVTIRHPVFVRDVFFYANTDPTGPSRWIRTKLLDENPYYQYVMSGYGQRLTAPVPGADQVGLPEGYSRQEVGAAYPNPSDVLRRVQLAEAGSSEYRSFVPPEAGTDYYYPLNGGTSIVVSLHDSLYCGDCSAWMRPGDGIGVAVLWADGVSGFFSVRQVRVSEPIGMGVLVLGEGSQYGAQSAEGDPRARFVVQQGMDFLVKSGLEWGAGAVGGPVAGEFTGMIVETLQLAGDVIELANIYDRPVRLVTFRSEASVTANEDGSMTLYTFSGSPSVTDEAGNEVAAGEGEGVTFAIEGAIGPAVPQEAPAGALAMQAAAPQEPGPYAGAIEPAADAGLGMIGEVIEMPEETLPDPETWGSEGTVVPPVKPPDDTPWGLIVGGGLGLLGGGAAVVLARKSRKGQPQGAPRAKAPAKPAQRAKAARTASPRARAAGPAAAAQRAKAARAASPAPEEALRTAGAAARCPECGNAVRPEGGFCSACGVKVAATAPTEAEPAASTPGCPHCGGEVGEHARFCGSCGRPLE
ncbi:MAG TPA: zinc ribbon domain-containing protein [Anaerolineae bacterium]|nr:zinc ribbon domain-containing protein [Anaerolineae bacterium]